MKDTIKKMSQSQIASGQMQPRVKRESGGMNLRFKSRSPLPSPTWGVITAAASAGKALLTVEACLRDHPRMSRQKEGTGTEGSKRSVLTSGALL